MNPEQTALVRRIYDMYLSGMSITAIARTHHRVRPFSGKLICGDCGHYFGSKTWHAGSKYEKHIWRCNNKYEGAEKCATPHLTDQQIKDTFTQAFEQLAATKNVAMDVDALIIKRFNSRDLEAQESALAGQVGAAAIALTS